MGGSVFERKKIFFLILFLLSLFGMVIPLLISSKWGIGLSPDSVTYINAARNLLNGLGLNTLSSLGGVISGDSPKLAPLTHFPPLYPLLLSSLGILGVDPLMGARLIAGLLFGANVTMIGLIAHRITRSVWLSIFGPLVILTSPDMIKIHIYAWSEPLFIFCSLLGLYFLDSYLIIPRVSRLVYSGAAICLAFLSRYVGLSLVIAGIIAILSFSREGYKKKIMDSAVFGFLSCLPMGLWIIRNLSLGQSATDREIYLHPVDYGVLKAGLIEISSWLLPYRTPTPVALIVVVLLVIGFLLINTMPKEEGRQSVIDKRIDSKSSALLGLFIPVYLGFVIIAISLFDAALLIDDRLLVPIHAPLVIVVVGKIKRLLMLLKDYRILGRGLVFACIGFLMFSVIRGYTVGIRQYEDGAYSYENKFNYNSKFWHESEVIGEIKNIPVETALYTNVPDAIYILGGRSSYKIPSKENYLNKKINSKYSYELESMGKEIRSQNGLLIYFSKIKIGNLAREEELREELHIILDKSLKDGSMYRAQK